MGGRRGAVGALLLLAVAASTLSPGDLVVHADYGIGRYDGLASIPVGTAPHECVALSYSGGDKLYVPVENIDILSRYGSENEGVQLDKLSGVALRFQRDRGVRPVRLANCSAL